MISDLHFFAIMDRKKVLRHLFSIKEKVFIFLYLCSTSFLEQNPPLKIASYLSKEVRNKIKPKQKLRIKQPTLDLFPPLEEMIEFHGANHPESRILFAAS